MLVDRVVRTGPAVQDVRPVAADRLATASANRGLVTANLRMESASPGLAMLNLATVRHDPLATVNVNRGLVMVNLLMVSASPGLAMLNPVIVLHALLVMVSESRGLAMLNPVIVPRVPAATVLSVMASASPGPRTADGQPLRETRVRGAQEATDPSAITTRIRSRRGSSSAAKSALSNQNLNHNSREQTLIVRLSVTSPR